ncbi:MAG: AraC family ligand binding domain-containing protein [Ruthenibacterium lactatiformans]
MCEHKTSTPPGDFRYHMHNEFEIFFCAGRRELYCRTAVYTLLPGDILLFNNTEFHYPTFRSNAEFERIVLHFDPPWHSSLHTAHAAAASFLSARRASRIWCAGTVNGSAFVRWR